MDNFGVSFAPTAQNQPTPQPGQNPSNGYGAGGVGNTVQDAVKILSLRIPRVVGAGMPTPLLGTGNSGVMDGLIAQLRRFFPGLGPQLQHRLPPSGGPVAGPSAPMPSAGTPPPDPNFSFRQPRPSAGPGGGSDLLPPAQTPPVMGPGLSGNRFA